MGKCDLPYSIIAFWHKRSIHVVFALISRIDKYIYMKSTVQVWGRINCVRFAYKKILVVIPVIDPFAFYYLGISFTRFESFIPVDRNKFRCNFLSKSD